MMSGTIPDNTSDSHALRVLEYNRLTAIVAGLADSAPGHDHLHALLPGTDRVETTARLAEAGECMDMLRFDDPFPGLSLHDLSPVFPRLQVEGFVMEIEDIAAVASDLELVRLVREYFDPREDKFPVLYDVARPLTVHTALEDTIRRTITPDMEVADDASPKLKKVRREVGRARDSLRTVVQKSLDALSDDVVSERHVTVRDGRLVIPVLDSMKRRVPGAVHDRSQTGKTVFIEPLASIECNNRVRELELEEAEEIHRILADLTARIAEIRKNIADNQKTLIRLDVIKARARYGVTVSGCVPLLTDTFSLSLKQARHPLLDWKWRGDSDHSVIPLDADLGNDCDTIVVTGPNAGGKTVAIKTVGLITAMALSGLPVPADEGTEVGAISSFYADIGDEQSIENDLSTFSSHMRHLVTIIDNSGSGSLVLLDELGGGTNPDDGAALAVSALKKLTDSGALTIATTHLGALKVFAFDTPRVANASMQFDTDKLIPTFAFMTGVPGSSYAFEIAGRLGMSPEVLAEAERIVGGERKTLEGLIAEMEEHRRLADEERQIAERERVELEAARREVERRLADLKERRTDLMAEAVADAEKLVDDANRRIESSIKTIRDEQASRKAIKAAKAVTEEVKSEVRRTAAKVRKPAKNSERTPVKRPEPGMPVWVASLGAEAVVEDVLDNGGKARVRIGKSKASVIVAAKELFTGKTPEKQRHQPTSVNVKASSPESFDIDLRGMTFDEARPALEHFLDQLHLYGVETGHIIHGKGTGALRTKVRGYLDTHEYVTSHRLGGWNEGSSGVTIITLMKS